MNRFTGLAGLAGFAIIAMAFVLTGCDGHSPSPSGSPETTPAAADSKVITVNLSVAGMG